MKTDLQKILFISGEHGLFSFVSQARNGIVAESLLTKKRSLFRENAKVSSLSDISIYTQEAEITMRDVLLKMKEVLGEDDAPDSKSDEKTLEKFFRTVIPDYDSERFYPSHMKKVVQWYNILKQHASLDFEEVKNEEEEETEKAEGKQEEKQE